MVVYRKAKNSHMTENVVTHPGFTLVPDGLYLRFLRDNREWQNQIKAGFLSIVVPPREMTPDEIALQGALDNARAVSYRLTQQAERVVKTRPLSKPESEELFAAQDAVSAALAKLDAACVEGDDKRGLVEILLDRAEEETVRFIRMTEDRELLKKLDEAEDQGQKRKAVFAAVKQQLEDRPTVFRM